jgi:hypothetical protein
VRYEPCLPCADRASVAGAVRRFRDCRSMSKHWRVRKVIRSASGADFSDRSAQAVKHLASAPIASRQRQRSAPMACDLEHRCLSARSAARLRNSQPPSPPGFRWRTGPTTQTKRHTLMHHSQGRLMRAGRLFLRSRRVGKAQIPSESLRRTARGMSSRVRPLSAKASSDSGRSCS